MGFILVVRMSWTRYLFWKNPPNIGLFRVKKPTSIPFWGGVFIVVVPNPSSFDPKLFSFKPDPSSFKPELSGFDPEPSESNPEPSRFDPEPFGFDPEPSWFDPEPFGSDPEPSSIDPGSEPSSINPEPENDFWLDNEECWS